MRVYWGGPSQPHLQTALAIEREGYGTPALKEHGTFRVQRDLKFSDFRSEIFRFNSDVNN